MKEGIFIALVVIFNIVIALISAQYGIAQSDDLCNQPLGEPCFEAPADPETGSFFDRVLAPIKYIWNTVSGFFAVVTFQIDGIPPIVGLMVILLDSIALWILIRLLRGV